MVGEVDSAFAERVTLAGNFAVSGAGGAITIDNSQFDLIAPVDLPFAADTGLISFHYPDESRVVPNIDAKLGLDYTYQCCNCSKSKLTTEAGYLVSHYFNSIDRLTDCR